MDSLEEENLDDELHAGSMTPQAGPGGKARKRGFFPLIGRLKSTSDSVSTVSTMKTVAGASVQGKGVESEEEGPQKSPLRTRWGRGRSGSGRESDGTAGSQGEL